jgi:hypothetical protein
VVTRISENSSARYKENWKTNDNAKGKQPDKAEEQLKDEIRKSRRSSPSPRLPDAALTVDDAVEQYESHATVDVQENDRDDQRQHNQETETDDEKCTSGSKTRYLKLLLARRKTPRNIAEKSQATSAATHLAAKESNDRQPEPLAETKREQHSLHPFKGGGDDIDCRNGHRDLQYSKLLKSTAVKRWRQRKWRRTQKE